MKVIIVFLTGSRGVIVEKGGADGFHLSSQSFGTAVASILCEKGKSCKSGQ